MSQNLSAEWVIAEKQWRSREQVARHFEFGLRTVGNLMRRTIFLFWGGNQSPR
jgi:hypothetical protein